MQWLEIGVIVILLFSVFNLTTVVSDFFKEKIGIETKATLQEKVIKQDNVIKIIAEANETLVDTINKKEESSNITKEVIVDKFKEEAKVEKVAKVVETKRVKTITDIKTKYQGIEPSLENNLQMEKEVSAKQIDSLWEIYCSEESNSSQCQSNKSVT